MLYDDLSLEVFHLRDELRETQSELAMLREQVGHQQQVIHTLRGILIIMGVLVGLLTVLVFFVYPLQVLLGGLP